MSRKKYVVIMAAGSGTRMGGEMPKQFQNLAGKMILRRTIEVFTDTFPDVGVITVLPDKYINYWREYCYRDNFICPQVLVAGGLTRFHSVRNALEKVPDGALVAVHDGVRPLLTRSMVEMMFAEAERAPALIPVVPCVDTIKVLHKETDENGMDTYVPVVGKSVDRSILYCAQTPQIFHSELLKAAYAQAYDPSFTDDGSVVEKYGKTPTYVMGERLNIKITIPEDLLVAEVVLGMRKG